MPTESCAFVFVRRAQGAAPAANGCGQRAAWASAAASAQMEAAESAHLEAEADGSSAAAAAEPSPASAGAASGDAAAGLGSMQLQPAELGAAEAPGASAAGSSAAAAGEVPPASSSDVRAASDAAAAFERLQQPAAEQEAAESTHKAAETAGSSTAAAEPAPASDNAVDSGAAEKELATLTGAATSSINAASSLQQPAAAELEAAQGRKAAVGQNDSGAAAAEVLPAGTGTATAGDTAAAASCSELSGPTNSSSSSSSSSSGDAGTPLRVLSVSAAKHNNLHLLDDDTLAMAAGSVVLLLHLPSMQQRYLPSRDGGGVASLAVHPSRQCFAVAEQFRGGPPNIYLYAWPSLAPAGVLAGATERAYAAAAFSADGRLLAVVGGAPDRTLSLWDWRAGSLLLRCRAFSADVCRVSCCPYSPGSLVTSGAGHIRFWQVATSFTGLKLQGQLGRFGGLELSDIVAFAQLPGDKVLSGSESGHLLLWGGGLVQLRVGRPGGRPCHDGAVEVLLHHAATNYVLSGGRDGVLRLWDASRLEAAEPEEGGLGCELCPAAELALPGRGAVVAALWHKGSWLVQSGSTLFKVSLPLNLLDSSDGAYVVTELASRHSAALLGVLASPGRHVVLTAAADGTLRALDYTSHKVLAQRRLGTTATCMAVLPFSADPQRRTLLLGYADGAVRLARLCDDGWLLLDAARPHKGRVACLAVSPDGGSIAAVADDSCVFFLSLAGGRLVPHVACQLPGSAPSCCCWSLDNRHLLVGFATGLAAEVEVPAAGSVDTSSTFLHPAGSSRMLQARLPQPAPGAGEHTTEQAPSPSGQAPPFALLGPALPLPSTADPFSEEAAELPVTCASYTSHDTFVLWLGGPAAGQAIECCWSQPTPLRCFAATPHGAVTARSSSWSATYELAGTSDGMVQLTAMQPHPGSSKADRTWRCNAHDMLGGRVCGLAMAHDGSCIISGAADGTLVLLCNPWAPAGTAVTLPPAAAAPLPTLAAELAALGAACERADLAADVPSLEETKQAAQRTEQAAVAAAARQRMQQTVGSMRQRLAALLAQVQMQPSEQRPSLQALCLDAGLEALVEWERQEKLADARAQVAYDAEVAALQLRKLQRFTAGLAVHNVTLHAMGGGCCVSTLRQAELPRELQDAIDAAAAQQEQLALQEQDYGSTAAGAGSDQAHGTASPSCKQAPAGCEAAPPPAAVPSVGAAASSVGRAEQWRQAKQARTAEWAALHNSRPDEAYEAPADVAAVAAATAQLGSFALKTDDDYVLRQSNRMTPAKARGRMLLLVRDMAAATSGFNGRVLGLREQKRALVAGINAMRARLTAINQQLGVPDVLQPLGMLPDEEPEQHLLDVSDAQLAAHKAATRTAASCLDGGFAMGRSTHAADSKPRAAAAAGGASAAAADTPCAQDQQAPPPAAVHQPPTELQLRRLQVERRQLTSTMAEQCAAFDAAVCSLRVARLELAADLKAAQCTLLFMRRELAVLQEAEVRELLLDGRRCAKAAEQAELVGRLADTDRQLEARRAAGDEAHARRGQVVAELESLLAGHDPFRQPLARLFGRRLKRAARRGPGGGDSSDELDGDDDDFDNDDDDEEAELCPPGCDPSLYEAVLELRERRLEEEAAAAEACAAGDALRKERDLLARKAKALDQSLAAIDQEVLAFQQEKQGRLNELPRTISLRCHQVELLGPDSRLPGDLSGALVFSQKQLSGLAASIEALGHERGALLQQQRQLQRAHRQLQANLAAKQAHLGTLEAHCRDVQQLKFGGPIDTSLLDVIGLRHKGVEELQAALKQQALAAAHELTEWDSRLSGKQQELLLLCRENTGILNALTDAARAQRTVEAAVLAARASLAHDPLDGRRATLAQQEQLLTTISGNAAQLESLRGQIAALKRK